MKILTLDAIAEMLESGPPVSDVPPNRIEIMVSQCILIYFLGHEVAGQICLSHSTARRFESARRYLRQSGSQVDSAQYQVERGTRMMWFAEALFNLQTVEGFDRLLDDIKSGSFQSAWEEAAFAMLLLQRNVPFRFLRPSPVSGEKTPDIEIIVDGIVLPCEVEGKIENGPPTEKTVYNTLEHARRQLPSDKPGIICLKIPERWKGEPAIPTVFKTINCFFEKTNRVVAVIVRSERHSPDDGDTPAQSRALLTLRRNTYSKLLTPAVAAALDRIWTPQHKAGGTPLPAVTKLLESLNTARKRFLEEPNPNLDFATFRADFLAAVRAELAREGRYTI